MERFLSRISALDSNAPRHRPAKRRGAAVFFSILTVVVLAAPLPAPAQQPEQDEAASPFAGLEARSIGPANTSGRTAAVVSLDRNPNLIYAGTATGGVWKTTDGGYTWEAIFDDQPTSSIGAVNVFEPNPDVVWVGTGEANPRNSAGVGRGVFKSRDGGKTWRHMGLEGSERIHRVVTHPTDPDLAYVAALGPAWSDGEERGVFRTRDGGETWERVLYVDESTGASDLVMDPSNPDHLIAATWQFRRSPWFFRSGGPGSGIHVTWDGGDTWSRLDPDDGLPDGELGRIGLAFSRSEPEVVYALVEAERSALLRSDDGGRTFRTVNDERGVSPRPFYYSDVFVDPANANRVYRVASTLDMSEDGGRSFETIAPWAAVHPDHHDLWISADGRRLIDANDGGIFISRNRGETWRFVENVPVSQFYHLSVDMDTPFNVYGGLQDNGSWRGPSQVWEQPGFNGSVIQNHHWRSIGFGDGFAALVDPSDPSYLYAMSQGGNLIRSDLRTGEWKSIRPGPPDDTTELRFNWNAGIAADPHAEGTVYYGSQFVHRTTDRGQTWEIISPDLTTDDPEKQRQAESGGLTKDVTAAENHTTLLTIAPSPVEEGVIWVGTDDGNVQVTRDGGATWTNVVGNIPGVPPATWVPHIEASKHEPGTAYVVFDNHRRGDWTTYVFRTTDYGQSWRSVATPAIDGFVHVIEEDPEEPRLLFVGTEFGMWYSLDRGASWEKWTAGLPTAPVRALVVHSRDHDLAIGTHGRGAFIVDDIRPLRELARTPAIAQRALHFFLPAPAIQHERGLAGPFYFPGHTKFAGDNRPYGALISYRLGEVPDSVEEVKIRIVDPANRELRELTGTRTENAVNRVVWDLERERFGSDDGEGAPSGFGPSGPQVLPGFYIVRVVAGPHSAEGEVQVVADPRREVPLAARNEKMEALMRTGAHTEAIEDAVRRLERTRETLELVLERIEDAEGLAAAERESLQESGEALEERIDDLLAEFRMPDDVVGIVRNTTISSRIRRIYSALESSTDQPSAAQMDELGWAEADLESLLARVDALYESDVPAFRRGVEGSGLDLWDIGRP